MSRIFHKNQKWKLKYRHHLFLINLAQIFDGLIGLLTLTFIGSKLTFVATFYCSNKRFQDELKLKEI